MKYFLFSLSLVSLLFSVLALYNSIKLHRLLRSSGDNLKKLLDMDKRRKP